MTRFSAHLAWRVASYCLDEAHSPSDIRAIRYWKGDLCKYNGYWFMFICEVSSPCRFTESLVCRMQRLIQAYEPGCFIIVCVVCQLCVKVHTYLNLRFSLNTSLSSFSVFNSVVCASTAQRVVNSGPWPATARECGVRSLRMRNTHCRRNLLTVNRRRHGWGWLASGVGGRNIGWQIVCSHPGRKRKRIYQTPKERDFWFAELSGQCKQ